MAKEKEEQEKVNDNYRKQLASHSTQLANHMEVLIELGKKCADNKKYGDKLTEKSDKAFKKLEEQRAEMYSHVSQTKEDLKERLGDLDKLFTEQIDEMNTELDRVRTMAKDQVAAKEKEL